MPRCNLYQWSFPVFHVFELCDLVAETEGEAGSSSLRKIKSIFDKIKINFCQRLPKGRQEVDFLKSCVFQSVPQPLQEGVLVPDVLQIADLPGCLLADQLLA